MTPHTISLSIRKAFITVLFIFLAGTASLFADTFYMQAQTPGNDNSVSGTSWGPSSPTVQQMASFISQYMGVQVTVVTNPFAYEDTAYPPITSQYSSGGTRVVATTGRIRLLSTSTLVTGITRAEIRAAGTDLFWYGGAYRYVNRFVMRAYTASTFYDVLVRASSWSGGAGYGTGSYDLYQISAPRALSALLNISVRSQVGTGQNLLFGGFYILGNDAKKVILRGMGPSTGLPGALQDPYLELRDSSGALVAANNNWQDSQASQIQAAGFAPGNAAEAAIIATLNPGPYTVTMSGVNGTSGAGLCEIYDLNQAANSQLVNLSGRAYVGTGNDALFAGLVTGPTNNAYLKVVIRGIGPSLGAFGISNPLQDPTLELYNANGGLLASNNNWRETQEAEIISYGLQPSDNRESAIVANLLPGSYTAVARGVNNTVGVGVVDLYKIQ
ncbi:MAG TPA: hypothetical protein VEX43_11420 [Chthoniobacterales bacterium]|nr:hypothetical protein [Chthoniobacterales bacterium]